MEKFVVILILLIFSILLNIVLLYFLFLNKTIKETFNFEEEEENKRLAQEAKELNKTFNN